VSRRWAGAVSAAVAGAIASAAFGRTGGGSHAGSGHTSSTDYSSGSHGVGGGGGSLGEIVALIIIALIIYAVYRRITRGSPSMPGVAGSNAAAMSALGAALGAAASQRLAGQASGLSAGSAAGLPPAIEAIRAKDPGFELETFLQRAEMTFFLVKRGMQQNDAAAVRPYLNDTVFAAVSASIGQSKAQHQHALLESLNVRALHVQNADCTEQQQRIQIHFDLVYRAKTLDDANRVVADEGEDGRHGERWTFVRAAAAQTPQGGGVTASRCPACGAELQLNLQGTCAHCKASVTNGSVDWVVADVQAAPFAGFSGESSGAVAAPTVAAGIASLRDADRDFAWDAFQARAQAAFLALQSAWCNQNLDAGRAFLSPGAYFTWRAQLETMLAERRKNVMENIQVHAIQPIQVVHGRVFDDLTVRIQASAADFEVDETGRIVFGDRTPRPFAEDWTFQRCVGAATSNKPGTLENTCPRCGAPVSLNQIGECRYCKAAVTSGKFDWVVSRIEQEDGAAGAAGETDTAGADPGAALALQVGGALVGGLLSSLLSGSGKSDDSSDWN